MKTNAWKNSPFFFVYFCHPVLWQTSDIGMTHNCGESGLCFEIWFRRRKSQDTYTLQAGTREMKEAWTKDLERILWEQAVHNKGEHTLLLYLYLLLHAHFPSHSFNSSFPLHWGGSDLKQNALALLIVKEKNIYASDFFFELMLNLMQNCLTRWISWGCWRTKLLDNSSPSLHQFFVMCQHPLLLVPN